MTLAEAIREVEALFTVHREVGLPTPYENQDGRAIGDGPRDMRRAPNGELYETVTSFGFDENLAKASAFFVSEGLAVQWWYDEIAECQRMTGARHLYWCVEPTFVSATYLAMDQAELLRTQSPMAALPQIELGFVTSKLLISKVGPDGKES